MRYICLKEVGVEEGRLTQRCGLITCSIIVLGFKVSAK